MNNAERAELLWLWYDYYTEKFDQQFPSIPSPCDEGSVIPVGKYRSYSNKHANKLQHYIYALATFYKVPTEVMNQEKRHRLQMTTKARLKKYEEIKEYRPEYLLFIEDSHERPERLTKREV